VTGRQRPGAWTRLTGAVNAAIWRAPLPRRLTTLLSLIVYRNPAVPASWLLTTVATLEPAGIQWVLIGGWAADALASKQLRPHRDIDLLIEEHDLERARTALSTLGYKPWHSDPDPWPLGDLEITRAEALRDPAMRVVELHCAELGGLELAAGCVAGQPVRCPAPDIQLQAQLDRAGRAWTPEQRRSRRLNIEAIEGAGAHPPAGA